ncbi:MAG: hypothetical protein LUF00_11460 [Lachnospiraceae bacterium]|nr:hypothetical protein [Lachnospiraceae bacterium]
MEEQYGPDRTILTLSLEKNKRRKQAKKNKRRKTSEENKRRKQATGNPQKRLWNIRKKYASTLKVMVPQRQAISLHILA